MKTLCHVSGLILGLRPANERRRYKVTPSHWLGANLESALCFLCLLALDWHVAPCCCRSRMQVPCTVWPLEPRSSSAVAWWVGSHAVHPGTLLLHFLTNFSGYLALFTEQLQENIHGSSKHSRKNCLHKNITLATPFSKIGVQINGLVQDCGNSIGNTWSYCRTLISIC